MARETNKRSRQASRPSSTGHSLLPGWSWGLAGLSVGLFVALLVQLHHSTPSSSEAVTGLFQTHEGAAGEPDGTPDEERASQRNEPQQPQFEFYKLLPDQEVSVPAPEPRLAAPAVKPPPAPTEAKHPRRPSNGTKREDNGNKESTVGYLLQVGSFRSLNDADQLKAHLALLGIEASIQNVELASGETWHRVRIGPFSNRANLNSIRERLQTNKIHTILLKRGG